MDQSADEQTQHRQRVQILKREIQQLCQKLQEEREDTLVVKTNGLWPDLECSMQGSNAGLKFVQSQQGVVTNFVKYFQSETAILHLFYMSSGEGEQTKFSRRLFRKQGPSPKPK